MLSTLKRKLDSSETTQSKHKKFYEKQVNPDVFSGRVHDDEDVAGAYSLPIPPQLTDKSISELRVLSEEGGASDLMRYNIKRTNSRGKNNKKKKHFNGRDIHGKGSSNEEKNDSEVFNKTFFEKSNNECSDYDEDSDNEICDGKNSNRTKHAKRLELTDESSSELETELPGDSMSNEMKRRKSNDKNENFIGRDNIVESNLSVENSPSTDGTSTEFEAEDPVCNEMNSEIANGQPSQSGKKSSISSNKEKQPEHISLTNERSPELLNEVLSPTNDVSLNQVFPNLSFEREDTAIPVEMLREDSADIIQIKCSEEPKTRKKHDWVIVQTFDNMEEALEYLDELGFSIHKDHNLKCGQKFYFRCKEVPKEKKKWCDRQYILFLPSNAAGTYIVQCNMADHNCHILMKGVKKRMSDRMKEFIQNLFELGTEDGNCVQKHIESAQQKGQLSKSEDVPNKRSIQNLLYRFKKAKVAPLFTLGDLMDWCGTNSIFPDSEDAMFVLAHECSSLNEKLSFRFLMSTPRLLHRSIKFETICIDATYKLNWHGYPLVVLGTVDRYKRFHPVAYGCTTHETTADYEFMFESFKESIEQHYEAEFKPKTLIADGSDAIRSAFYKSFPSAELDVMCFAHVIRNIRKRTFSTKSNKQLILDDIRKIQLAPNKQTFLMMTKLFCDKWRSAENEFVDYFTKEWLGGHCNWYEGAAIYTPSTNNALESHNAIIKRTITLRRRLPLNQFLLSMTNLLVQISMQFASGTRTIESKPIIKTDLLMQAALLRQQNFKAFKAKTSVPTFIVPSSICPDELANVAGYGTVASKLWLSFDEFINHGYQLFWMVQLSSTGWDVESTCTCPVFFKQNVCKHIVALAMRENLLPYSDSMNPTVLAAVRKKPGRPKNAASALMTQ